MERFDEKSMKRAAGWTRASKGDVDDTSLESLRSIVKYLLKIM
jgi:hypothetical protein